MFVCIDRYLVGFIYSKSSWICIIIIQLVSESSTIAHLSASNYGKLPFMWGKEIVSNEIFLDISRALCI